jgi:hypothetical protein
MRDASDVLFGVDVVSVLVGVDTHWMLATAEVFSEERGVKVARKLTLGSTTALSEVASTAELGLMVRADGDDDDDDDNSDGDGAAVMYAGDLRVVVLLLLAVSVTVWMCLGVVLMTGVSVRMSVMIRMEWMGAAVDGADVMSLCS